ncbi:hypothetical protein IMG5_186230 [Ichthyophthirius multifiliis]|uniref:Protein kinase domain protein n=1 Tax=Ichthyophthirius multifiliis TaxID=5932 RepID=G0R3L5_ICHMU|nr:hypothetical protein IMG5_186230 [Ichthyophthirius multifiliis]EGR27937.1 hypothetical protein IMG5_186230 [Ichthyophthirius multifiliis]|eukprot:XP_004027282.1 hypothetical protein IMG5_186230 [Ichthyophthirius multifiliis]
MRTLEVDPALRISTSDLFHHPFVCEENMAAKLLEDIKKEENKSNQNQEPEVNIQITDNKSKFSANGNTIISNNSAFKK